MAFVETTGPEEASGELAGIYREIEAARGGVAAIHQCASILPNLVGAHFDFYKRILFSEEGLDRADRERIAVAVSEANRCPYCQKHHGEALCRLPHAEADDAVGRALIEFARKLTLRPAEMEASDIQALREAGLDDASIVDATFIAGYFNFANRLVNALGVDLEPDFEDTCR